MPSGLLDGLPIGILLFGGMALGIAWRKLASRRAARGLPELARDLNLEFSPARDGRGQGFLKGRYQGYDVRVDPEEARAIVVYFKEPQHIELRTYEQYRHPPEGWVAFQSSDRTFDRFFKTRLASEALAQQFADAARPSQYLDAFIGPYQRQLDSLTVTEEGVRCLLNFGKPAHIPVPAIRALLPVCIALASFVESSASLPDAH